MGTDADGKYSDSQGVEKLMKYANLFRLNEKSGLEITEVSPKMSTSDALRTSIGQSDLSARQICDYYCEPGHQLSAVPS